MDQNATLPPLTASQLEALAAIPELGDSVFPRQTAVLPAANYTDPARFAEEMRAVFHRLPVIAGPSALLAEPRSYFHQELAGMPILVTRNKDGKVNAFANVCRHRGMKLCTAKDPERAPRIVCPYHAWSYNLDGELVGMPRAEVFPGLDKSTLGLTRLPCVEAGGLIWVGLTPDHQYDFSLIEGQLGQELGAIGLQSAHVFDRAVFTVQGNWKLVMDSMLDSYHVTRLHKDSLGKFFVDAQNILDCIGPHMRVATARGNFRRELVSDEYDALRQIMIFAYTPFPNGIIVPSPDFTSLGIVRPLSVDRTEVDYYVLAARKPETEKMEGKLRRSFELMRTVFGTEDYWAAEMCHAGLKSGAIKEIYTGGMEVQIPLFHGFIEQALQAAK